MEDSQKKINSIEINDLVSEAIINATERRKKGAELENLSMDELDKIRGGAQPDPTTIGRQEKPTRLILAN